MKRQFSKSISPILWAVALIAGVPFGNSAWAGPEITTEKTIVNQPIEFRTLVPDRPIVLPKKGGDGITVEKFGVRITNNSSSVKVFSSDFIEPSFVDENGKIMSLTICSYSRTAMLEKENFTSLKPGESIDFLYPTYFIWHHGGIIFEYGIPDGGSCGIRGLKAGRYSVSIAYGVERYSETLNNTALWHQWSIDPKSVWKEGVKSIPAQLELLENR